MKLERFHMMDLENQCRMRFPELALYNGQKYDISLQMPSSNKSFTQSTPRLKTTSGVRRKDEEGKYGGLFSFTFTSRAVSEPFFDVSASKALVSERTYPCVPVYHPGAL
jgi:hypothetical protein